MYNSAERNERKGQRHALVLAVALHLALVAMLYFKMSSESASRPDANPKKVNVTKERPTASAKTIQLP